MTENGYLLLWLIGHLIPFLAFWLFFRKKGRRAGRLGLAAYVGIYIILSAVGRFFVINHGGSDWTTEWCPPALVRVSLAFSGRLHAELTPIGMLFWPCLAVDRVTWHAPKPDAD